jgi:hypothetical protein
MKKILLVVVGIMFSGIILAQRADHRQRNADEIAERQTEKMKTELALSEQQSASVRRINLKYADLMSKLRSDTSLIREDRHSKIKTLQAQKKSELDAVLSAEQSEKWEEYRKSAGKGKRGFDGKKRSPRGVDMKQSLSLSDDQSSRMEAAQRSFKDQLHAIHADKQLSDDQRKEKARAARARHEKEVQSILSGEQFDKWKALKKDRAHDKLKREHYYKK